MVRLESVGRVSSITCSCCSGYTQFFISQNLNFSTIAGRDSLGRR